MGPAWRGCAIAVALGALLAPAPVAASTWGYAALGDSYSAAPSVGSPMGPSACGRTTGGYPQLVALQVRPGSYANVTCSGSRTAEMTAPQKLDAFEQAPPQFDALTPATALVTVGIGGNDAGYFQALLECGQQSLLSILLAPCSSRYQSPDRDRLAEAIAATGPKIGGMLAAIHARSGRARVLLVGYPDVLPTDGRSCPPFAAADVLYFGNTERRLNAMLATQAAAGGAEFVDTYAPSVGHDACQPADRRWVQGTVPSAQAAALHPNSAGEQAMARDVLAKLASRPGQSGSGPEPPQRDVSVVGRPHVGRANVRIRLACGRPTTERCVGRITVTARGRGGRHGSANYSVAGGETAKVRIKLSGARSRRPRQRSVAIVAKPRGGGPVELWPP